MYDFYSSCYDSVAIDSRMLCTIKKDILYLRNELLLFSTLLNLFLNRVLIINMV